MAILLLLFFFTLVIGPRRALGLKLSDTRVYEPEIRTAIASHQVERISSIEGSLGAFTFCMFDVKMDRNKPSRRQATVLYVPHSLDGGTLIFALFAQGRLMCKATWERNFKLPWREAGTLNHHDKSRLSMKNSLSLLAGVVWRGGRARKGARCLWPGTTTCLTTHGIIPQKSYTSILGDT